MLRDTNGRFARGGAGRPFGSRGRVSRSVANAIVADFAAHQDEVLPRLREWFVTQYAAVVGWLMPRDADNTAADEVDPETAVQRIAAARGALARIGAGEGMAADREGPAGEGAETEGTLF